MTTTDLVTPALTAEDLTALRSADTISFHGQVGEGIIRAHLNGGYDSSRIYTAREQRLFTQIDTPVTQDRSRDVTVASNITGYGTDGGTWTVANNSRGFAMNHSPKYDADWQTIVSLLKVGDSLTLKWTADNNSPVLTERGLHHDELRLVVSRMVRGKVQRMTFLLKSRAGLDNSARMITATYRHGEN